jgi:hypothetical protein
MSWSVALRLKFRPSKKVLSRLENWTSPLVFGLLTDSMGLSFTITVTALMVFVTIPLSRHLSLKP